MAVDEPKQLVAKVAAYSMGVSILERVKVYPIGSSIIEDAFIPVIPSVQLGERLGLPTQGYYYHFHNGQLVQEYKLLGDKKWAFYATCSTHDKLNDEQGFNIVQSAILVYWKLSGKKVEDQSLVYLEQQITREELAGSACSYIWFVYPMLRIAWQIPSDDIVKWQKDICEILGSNYRLYWLSTMLLNLTLAGIAVFIINECLLRNFI